MKANELMIGDFVLSKSDDKIYKINSIITLDDGSNLVATEDGLCFDYMCDAIPITAEILEKNGFEVHRRYIWERRNDYCCVRVRFAPKTEIEGEVFNEPPILLQIDTATISLNIFVDYVHQLQHALWLCGVEKEINFINYEQYREDTDKKQSKVV